ncbi:MAG: 5'/3'-nucleotidase SurE, partial [Paludibacteraceae bacterium]|nr:5'/3'-nucleotidase SurE [Paludibacteraceae bacterium]
MKRPLILITNDDGIYAPGLKALIAAVKTLGDVLVVAPDGPRSAQSNALTVTVPLRSKKLSEEPGVAIWQCNGTPTDCVKMGIRKIADRWPDILLSGINHGRNTSISVIYSGTMGAALEGCVDDIPSIGISHCDFRPDADFTAAGKIAYEVTAKVLKEGLPRYTCLNVNVPETQDIKGIRISRQAAGHWEEVLDQRQDPTGRNYYWLGGEFVDHEPDAEDTDEWAVQNG